MTNERIERGFAIALGVVFFAGAVAGVVFAIVWRNSEIAGTAVALGGSVFVICGSISAVLTWALLRRR